MASGVKLVLQFGMLDLTHAAEPPQIDPATHTGPHAVIIGSGFGGLAAAVRLGARGYVSPCSRSSMRPGGRAYVHRQDGFTFDAGPTIITAPFLLEELGSSAGRRLADDIDLRPMKPFYRLRFDDGTGSTARGDPDADARRGGAALARRRRRLRAIHGAERRSAASVSRNSATCRSASSPTWRGSRRDLIGWAAGAASTRPCRNTS